MLSLPEGVARGKDDAEKRKPRNHGEIADADQDVARDTKAFQPRRAVGDPKPREHEQGEDRENQ